jgi:hypothetical protein
VKVAPGWGEREEFYRDWGLDYASARADGQGS